MRKSNLLRKYSLTVEQYEALFVTQKGRCAICGKKRTWRALAVDHCHITNKVRSLLCATCNNHLGVYEKHRDKFEAYLKKHQTTVVDHGEGPSWAAAAHK